MATKYNFEKRRYVIGAIALIIVSIYLVRLFTLQLLSEDYRKSADSNALRKNIIYPSRGLITDRNGKLLVYNEASYNIMVTMQEQRGVDTLAFCRTIGITRQEYEARMNDIKDKNKHPGYSRNTPQLFMGEISAQEFSAFREKLFRFRGFTIEKRSVRRYAYGIGAHFLGNVGEVSQTDIDSNDYYRAGDYIGKFGIERSYEKQLRGKKGMEIFLRDVHGRTQGRYQNGEYDTKAQPGKNISLGIDLPTQQLAERLLRGKLGAIVAIEPATGQILAMASGPTYDLRLLTGKKRNQMHRQLLLDPTRPLLNRAISGTYPPGSTFKLTQALIGLQEQSINPQVAFPCYHGFNHKGLHLGCHGHASPTPLLPAIETSCNAYFCWNLIRMFGNRAKYKTVEDAMTVWKDHLVSMGFGYKLGIDLPSEKRGMIPNAAYYDKAFKNKWNALTVISIAIGQGEITTTPLQTANLCATIANRGHYFVPHIARSIQGGNLDTLYTRPRHTSIQPHWYTYAVEGMRRAVLNGTCRGANLPGIAVCGKTGTAQNRGRDHSAFMGFAPMHQPQIAVSVYIENGGFGADFAVPIGALIIEQYINGKLSPAAEQRAVQFQNRHIKYATP